VVGALDAFPDRALDVAEYEASNASAAPVTVFPVSWYDGEVIYSLLVFLTRGDEPRPLVVAYDEGKETWRIVAEPDPDRGFDEIGGILRPWFEDVYGTIPEDLAVAPPDYDLPEEIDAFDAES